MLKLLLLLVIIIPLLFISGLAVLCLAMLRGAIYSARYTSRFEKLKQKYGNEELARTLAKGEVFTGQTAEQLRDAKGEPFKVLDNGAQMIWLYQPMGFTRLPMRIIIENEKVKQFMLG